MSESSGDSPPDLTNAEIDFSQFHATGDHWPFSRYCRSQYGGGWNHLLLAWEYRCLPWLRRCTLCRVGLHHEADGWQREPGGDWRPLRSCLYCMEEL